MNLVNIIRYYMGQEISEDILRLQQGDLRILELHDWYVTLFWE